MVVTGYFPHLSMSPHLSRVFSCSSNPGVVAARVSQRPQPGGKALAFSRLVELPKVALTNSNPQVSLRGKWSWKTLIRIINHHHHHHHHHHQVSKSGSFGIQPSMLGVKFSRDPPSDQSRARHKATKHTARSNGLQGAWDGWDGWMSPSLHQLTHTYVWWCYHRYIYIYI